MKTIEQMKAIAEDLVYNQDFIERNKIFDTIDDIDNLRWNIPDIVRQQLRIVREEISHDGHDALNTASRIFARLQPSIDYVPFIPNEETREATSEMEDMVRYYYFMASRRTSPSLTQQLTRQAAKFGVNCFFVEDVEWMAKHEGADQDETNRRLQSGLFSLNIYDPRTVYPIRDRYGLKGIVVRAVKKVHQLVTEYPGHADEIIRAVENADTSFDKWEVFEYWDLKERGVFAHPYTGAVTKKPIGDTVVLLEPGEHGIPFFPWVYESEPVPLLFSVAKSNKWKTKNLMESLLTTEVLARFAEATDVVRENRTGDVNPPFGKPGEPVRLKPSTTGEDFQRVPRSQLDANMITLIQSISASMEGSTLSTMLRGGDIPNNVALSTIQLKINTDLAALAPYQRVTERALEQAFWIMSQWVRIKKKSVSIRVVDEGSDKLGQGITIEPDTIPEDGAHFRVQLHSDVPTDRQARVNTAVAAVNALNMPLTRALKDIGISDPQRALEEREQEKLDEVAMAGEIQKMQAQAQMDVQAMMMGFRDALSVIEEAERMQTAQQAAGGPPTMGSAPPAQGPIGQSGFPGGPEFDPAMGGQAPIAANPTGLDNRMTGDVLYPAGEEDGMGEGAPRAEITG